MPLNINISALCTTTLGVLMSVHLTSCQPDNVPYDTHHLAAFHKASTSTAVSGLDDGSLALFVDYSTCMAKGMESPFYQKMVSPLTAATKNYWAIKGDDITQEEGNVYELLNNITEINYAALDKAIAQMADMENESVMLTDGELFTQTVTKNNPNNPYMHAAFKKWLLKGHDIHIIAEPYKELYKGQAFNKKRFYIIFTDERLKGNIYSRLREIVNFEDFPQVDEFHMSGNYPWVVPTNGKSSVPNPNVAANIASFGAFEIQDWQVDWKNIINMIMCALNDNGQPYPHGDKIIGGLHINKNAFGCYRIKDIDVKVTNINADYFDFYNRFDSGGQIGKISLSGSLVNNFIMVDRDEFNRHSTVDLYFDVNNFAPDADLNGKPFNYFRIDIVIKDLSNIINNSIDMFNFESIVNKGKTNESISQSLKNCVFDPELMDSLKGTVLYTIYVKSDKYK